MKVSVPLISCRVKLVELARHDIEWSINTPESVAALMTPVLRDFDREAFCAVHLDTGYQPLGYEICAVGMGNAAYIQPAEVFRSALLSAASALVIVHNHPSGVLEPSAPDARTVKRMCEAGEVLGIPVVDALILAPSGNYYSFLEHERMPNKDKDAKRKNRISN